MTSTTLLLLLLLLHLTLHATSAQRPPPVPHFTPQQAKAYHDDLRKWFEQHPRTPLTCDNYPRLCSFPGSLQTDCCDRRCVSLSFDMFHCGICNNRCGFGQICCSGHCSKVMVDPKNCGWCGNRCAGAGSSCWYGLCNYA